MKQRIAASLVVSITLTLPLFASGAGSMPQRSPHDLAVMSYNDGLQKRDKAWKLEKERQETQDPARSAKLDDKINGLYKGAAKLQQEAVKNDPRLFQAWSELGYALRKTGDYDGALASYDKALSLMPNYAEALEYRAEAYLALSRVDEVKQTYLTLFNGGAPDQAKQLGQAMQKWVAAHKTDPQGAGEKVNELSTWLEQRNEIAKSVAASGSSW